MIDRPNILYVFTDQQEARAMRCAGTDEVRTPAMDSLAARGVRFEKAYCTSPLCTPSRASMFTGRMPHEIGIDGNGQPIAKTRILAGLGRVLRNSGYDCVYGGKWHVPEIAIPDGHGFRSICGFSDRDLPDRCAAFIREKHDTPFFLVASFDNPHSICEWARNEALPWGNVPDARLEDCPMLPPNFPVAPYEPEAIRREQEALFMYRKSAFTPDDWRRYRHAYYRIVEKADAGLGAILDALSRAGLDERTLIIFSSDHGDGIGAHQWNQKSVLYEESVRVPLILVPPGGRKHGGGVNATHLVSNGLDLYPTICDYAGAEVPKDLAGLSLRPVLEGEASVPWRTHLVAETTFDGGLGTRGLMVRTERYKYCVYSWGNYREQLFDMDRDPGEMVNLAVDFRLQDVLHRHRDILAAWIRETDYRQGAHYAHPASLPVIPGQDYP